MVDSSHQIPIGKVIALLALAVVIGVGAMSYAASTLRGDSSGTPETTVQTGKQNT